MENEDPLGSPPYYTPLPSILKKLSDPYHLKIEILEEFKDMPDENETLAYLPGTIVEVVKSTRWEDEEDSQDICDFIIGQIGVITIFDPSDSEQTYFVSFNADNNQEHIKDLLEANDFANNSVSDCFHSYSNEVTSKFVLFENRAIAKMDTRVGFWFSFEDIEPTKALFPREGRFL